ncbi:MAG: dTMP kinase [Planctomycetes bacterium]|nr:dTMP kinase [Planctomycetota bacterium]
MRGRLLVLEGIDGAGKTTQADILETRLRREGVRVLRAREPGGTRIGERVRALLLDARRVEMDARTELFLYMASRAQLVSEVLAPALARGRVVLLDRYYYSTAAYQGAAGGVGIDEALALAERIAGFPRADRVILLDLDPRTGMARVNRPMDRMEKKGIAYLARVRAGFLRIARREPRRFAVVPADRPPETVAGDVYRRVRNVL